MFIQGEAESLAQAAGLALGLEQHQDVPLTHRPLDVTDNRAIHVVQELYADLSHGTTRSSPPHHHFHPSEFRPRVCQLIHCVLMGFA
eukprot:CAMPEP_0181323274 /NCGR_PEP_ID=MMETSP1101-20121128/19691_1 /TAXON_ID=46948 /ORGANISM="Rhodomonas abbreviata, Strain Caron Lab Isolate" /LENGTH=86 /DNA_ID=CAMNT_0023431277 /DNA_START=69 /DNA_END=326 /DNA_ORIENTATION=+